MMMMVLLRRMMREGKDDTTRRLFHQLAKNDLQRGLHEPMWTE